MTSLLIETINSIRKYINDKNGNISSLFKGLTIEMHSIDNQ